MPKKVFISYRHSDAAWVRDTLYPVLSAGGAQVGLREPVRVGCDEWVGCVGVVGRG